MLCVYPPTRTLYTLRQPFSTSTRSLTQTRPIQWQSRLVRAEPDNGNNNQDIPPPVPSEEDTTMPPTSDLDPSLQLPQSVITRLRDTVFGIDTLFVTSVENYQANGVLFKGNLRGDPQVAFNKMNARLRSELGDEYELFLLQDREEKPVGVVIPKEAVQQGISPTAEKALAVLFGLTTVATTLNINDAQLFNAALLVAKFDPALVQAAVPGTLAFLAILAAHEIGHITAAKKHNIVLAPPLLLPAGLGLLGSFGSITRFKSQIPDRTVLASVTASGPLYGVIASLVFIVIGLVLTASGSGGIEVDSASFQESLLIGGIGQLIFGERLFTSAALSCNPLFVAGWAGLIVNSINCIPAGELDGGRLALSLWGRRSASNISTITLFVLGLVGITNALALFWLLLVLTIQRGPLMPCSNELSDIEDEKLKWASRVLLILPLLVLLPYPFFSDNAADIMASF